MNPANLCARELSDAECDQVAALLRIACVSDLPEELVRAAIRRGRRQIARTMILRWAEGRASDSVETLP